MSFHGGAIGVIARALAVLPKAQAQLLRCSAIWFAWSQPIGQFFGRIANFINGELWGKPGDVPWAMVFPRAP